ncbi:minor capsid protein [Paenibacillus albicereus]|uniref:Minor capsid protein n=1 Tax=Paenibacillus albicereus TaxID=2726185 RepID=A0A6H2H084_9BACL|nr:minor capsid protein [Paenibacillus albicereus]QJC53062.1 minor capsid protein [Paenibacillus albicereus]
MRSDAYWERRARERMAVYHKDADATVRTVWAAYRKARADIQAEINKIVGTFGRGGQLDPAQARHLLNQRIPDSWMELGRRLYARAKDDRVKRYLLTRLNAPAYRARVTRLEALQEMIRWQMAALADVELAAVQKGYMDTITDAYYRTMFDLQQGVGIGFDFARMPARTVEEILRRPWSGQHFSDRVWTNTGLLAQQVTEVVTAGMTSGRGVEKMARELSERMEVGRQASERLIRTETTYMANASEMESYEAADIDQYMFVATLDLRTSPQCQKADRKIYAVADAKPGVNMPPLHPYCRSTTRAWFGPETIEGMQRRARDLETGKTVLVPASMTYAEWHKQYAG